MELYYQISVGTQDQPRLAAGFIKTNSNVRLHHQMNDTFT